MALVGAFGGGMPPTMCQSRMMENTREIGGEFGRALGMHERRAREGFMGLLCCFDAPHCPLIS